MPPDEPPVCGSVGSAHRTHMSQAVFAAFLNTSVSTVQKWEIGEKKPSGPSLKLLNLIDKKGVDALV
jgi:putative transcriptional regulator